MCCLVISVVVVVVVVVIVDWFMTKIRIYIYICMGPCVYIYMLHIVLMFDHLFCWYLFADAYALMFACSCPWMSNHVDIC